ncbi:hypothetical protein MUN84_01490 [Hymenobacter sp. 5516J-16]|uniref:Tetratricopeptide repeat protein n=1 Tax=Hymenobacter sublimis TaxID=2933777 RepID=A0ABY4JE50_9BACT|nr:MULTISPECIES: hypothetical protein [Hymenobacter]UOQ77420.1 hypothetical protein MUN84_01490 [Hymenobacter sp. 5516J-16]UPL51096.1 hypothetical protein MWH26_09340 [Hymenobacter sublimis]
MTRASLLHILDHVNGISDTEVRELEQLAATFPYCQTAHVLLAKAAHDRGSMLANQRLRRAATYAADRELLRQLLEQPAAAAPAPVPDSVAPSVSTTAVAAVTADIPAEVQAEALLVTSQLTPTEDSTQDRPTQDDPASISADILPSSDAQSGGEVAVIQTEERSAPEQNAELIDEPETQSVYSEVSGEEELTKESDSLVDDDSYLAPTPVLSEGENSAFVADAPVTTPKAPAATDEAENSSESRSIGFEAEPEQEVIAENDTPSPDGLLPAVAPPIRPPVEAGISRFEFGLIEPELPAPSGYRLPELDEEADEEPELPTLAAFAAAPPVVTAPFRADEDLGYALGAGSRLGYDLQAHDGYTLDLPLDAFFEPDALLLAHLKQHQPKPSASSLDLINRFLKTQPRIKTPAGVPLPAEEQMDLSVRSTSPAPALASESLAKIMVRQGKKDKAIEIYERLMERQPEKKAYFAEQIQQLQQPSE